MGRESSYFLSRDDDGVQWRFYHEVVTCRRCGRDVARRSWVEPDEIPAELNPADFYAAPPLDVAQLVTGASGLGLRYDTEGIVSRLVDRVESVESEQEATQQYITQLRAEHRLAWDSQARTASDAHGKIESLAGRIDNLAAGLAGQQEYAEHEYIISLQDSRDDLERRLARLERP